MGLPYLAVQKFLNESSRFLLNTIGSIITNLFTNQIFLITFKYIIMISALIGLAAGLLVIFTLRLIKGLNETIMYGLILSGIGFLYVGYTWSDWQALTINFLQATVFVFLAYFGIKKSSKILIAGYFLHGVWDLCYGLFLSPMLLPPHYDWFCLTIDFTMGFYLLGQTFKTVRSNTLATTLQSQN